jgi:hypothetical protein
MEIMIQVHELKQLLKIIIVEKIQKYMDEEAYKGKNN